MKPTIHTILWLGMGLLISCTDTEKEELPNNGDGPIDENNPSNEETDNPDTNDTNNSDDCSDYRTSYPSSGYGTSVGSVLADFPGMVDKDGNPVSLADIYADKTKVALVIANAFDT